MASGPAALRLESFIGNPSKELLSGLVVAFAMIPEAIAFSGIAGVDPQVGLFGAFCLSITIAFVGGRSAMITSATGSTALLMTGLVATGEARGPGLGLAYLLVAGVVTGILQILWGWMRLAYQMRFVPLAVLSGFVNALALLIFQAQLPQLGINLHFGETKAADHAHDVVFSGLQLPIIWGLVLLGLVIIYGLPRLTRVLPSQLVAIVVLTVISVVFNLADNFGIPTVSSLGDLPTGLPMPSWPFGSPETMKVPFSLETLGIVLPTALAISLVGLMETFLTQDILDDRTDSNSNKNVEARGQGIANIASSLFGGMAGCALVGQSVMNIDNGGRTRLSTLFSGISLLAMILLARPWLQQIPMAALVAVMISIAVSTADVAGLRRIRSIPKSDTAVMLMTFAVTMLTTPHNLALGVLAGVALAGILFSRKVAKVIRVEPVDVAPDLRRYVVTGQLFFVSKIYFLQGFDVHDHPAKIIIDMSSAHIWDQSGVGALNQLIRKLRQGGSEVEVVGLNNESLDLFERIGAQPEASHG
ncbi:SulP family inorganic anion transporter [Synechococcus sp. CS-197]|uniref:SulP family inorganic anion transporter n=1 Tax=Synechococcus sp. CS-197 TaxID=2847985 RepID=UPI0001525A1C|nr:SulP family inorganic anion transporter [Synechococcus sp. CS-197]MCT0250572.1 SulP family inorganic anion transporter [Synechococcus sp. CS-197]CAK23846.1 Sulfate permease, MFS superfamily [Synechococcus sp. WH 7803]